MDSTVQPRDVSKGDQLRCRYRGDILVAWSPNSDGRTTQVADVWVPVVHTKLSGGFYHIGVRHGDKTMVLGPYGGRTQLTVRRPDPPQPAAPPGLLDGAKTIASLYVSLVVTGPDGSEYVAEITDEFEIKLRAVGPG